MRLFIDEMENKFMLEIQWNKISKIKQIQPIVTQNITNQEK